jgi:hypothetical protein
MPKGDAAGLHLTIWCWLRFNVFDLPSLLGRPIQFLPKVTRVYPGSKSQVRAGCELSGASTWPATRVSVYADWVR